MQRWILFFSTSRNAALKERKRLQYTTLPKNLYRCTLDSVNIHAFTQSDVLSYLSKHCADQKQHSNAVFLNKSDTARLQTSITIAFEYLQAWNNGTGKINYLWCTVPQSKRVCYPMFLLTFVLSQWLFAFSVSCFT